MSDQFGDELATTERDRIVWDHLRANGISSIEDAPDEILEEAHKIADKALGKGNDD